MSHVWPMALLVAAAASTSVLPTSAPIKKITLEQAVEKVQHKSGGHVLAADTLHSRHGSKYRIKLLTTDGRVRVVEVNSTPLPPPPQGSKVKPREKH